MLLCESPASSSSPLGRLFLLHLLIYLSNSFLENVHRIAEPDYLPATGMCKIEGITSFLEGCA